MHYLFLGSYYFPEEEYVVEGISKCGLQNSIVNFQNNMLCGLRDYMQEGDTLSIINYYPLGTYPNQASKLIIKGEKKSGYQRLSLINIHLIKQLWYNYQARMAIHKWIKKIGDDEGKIIMYDLLRPYLKTLSSLENDNVKTYTIIADLPNEFGYNKKERGVKAFVKKRIGYQNMKLVGKLNYFGLLTKQMSEPLRLNENLCTVIEGFSNEKRFFAPLDNDSMIILYTGLISVEYNIDGLLTAFSMLDGDQYKLWICGPGPSVDLVKEYAKKDKRIIYKGCIPSSKIATIQSQSTVLINPRLNKGEFTKYSFPSKIIEYLSTARPVIAYKLSGIPDVYYNYLIPPKDDTPECLSALMKQVLDLPLEQKREIGLKGREFVIERTRPYMQMKKLLTL